MSHSMPSSMAINNSLPELIAFFGTPERPVTPKEFKDFWLPLTDAEKDYYKSQPLVMASA